MIKKLIFVLIVTHLTLINGQKTTLKDFKSFAHDLRSNGVQILNEKQIEINGLRYDGTGPAAWFVVGSGDNRYRQERPDALNGTKIPNEKGSCDILPKYSGEKIILTLPKDKTWSDYEFLSMYCVKFRHNFGYIEIPSGLKLDKFDGLGVKECGSSDGNTPENHWFKYLVIFVVVIYKALH